MNQFTQRSFWTIALFISFNFSFAQQQLKGKIFHNSLGQNIEVIYASSFAVSGPLKSTPDNEQESEEFELEDLKEVPIRRAPFDYNNPNAKPAEGQEDVVWQKEEGTRKNRSVNVNVSGLSSNGYPPDPSGGVGNEFYIQAVNSRFRVYNKQGAGQGGSKGLSYLWPGSTNDGDPIVMYDKHADRWFISQFQVQSKEILIAVSKTEDPKGEYSAYTFKFNNFPDYPKYSIWWDGYYMSSNSGHTAVVFEREKMLQGDPNARAIILSLPNMITSGFRCGMPSTADGQLPPNGTPCYFFTIEDDAWNSSINDRIKVYAMETDWNTVSNTKVEMDQTINVSPMKTFFGYNWDNIEQKGSSQKLDAISGILYYRAPYRVWSGHNSVVLSCVVNLGGNRAGIRWWELRNSGSGPFSIHQESTYAPNTDNNSRWMSSIAMDDYGNIGLIYNYSGPTAYPGIRYTGRLAGDPLNTMTIKEFEVVEGQGAQQSVNRYGDYSHLEVDPNGHTFWGTAEYTSSSGAPRTQIFSFNLEPTVNLNNIYHKDLKVLVKTISEKEVSIDVKGLHGNENLTFDLFDSQGKLLQHRDISPVQGDFKVKVDGENLLDGLYLVRFGNENFQKVVRVVF